MYSSRTNKEPLFVLPDQLASRDQVINVFGWTILPITMAQHGPTHVASSQKALMLEMKSLQEEPVEGFRITLVDEADLYNWEVAIFGPPNTHYEGGYFKVRRRLT